jgi:hypothetical protein
VVHRPKSTLCVFAVLLSCIGCRVNRSDAPGKYMTDGKALAVEVRADGTFANYSARQNSSGTWQINEHRFFDQGIELDGGTRQDGFADEYHLVQRYGTLCIEVHDDTEYWCKP